jgi:hypothetical protein
MQLLHVVSGCVTRAAAAACAGTICSRSGGSRSSDVVHTRKSPDLPAPLRAYTPATPNGETNIGWPKDAVIAEMLMVNMVGMAQQQRLMVNMVGMAQQQRLMVNMVGMAQQQRKCALR